MIDPHSWVGSNSLGPLQEPAGHFRVAVGARPFEWMGGKFPIPKYEYDLSMFLVTNQSSSHIQSTIVNARQLNRSGVTRADYAPESVAVDAPSNI